jgi:alkyl hydroperoxide reductase subunit AhpC
MNLDIGDAAPSFTLPTDGGGKVSLTDFKGKPVVLYFYPKDDTSGCTAEACAFRDLKDEFAKLKELLRKLNARTIDQLWRAIGGICSLFTPDECWNFFRHCGYANAST